MILQRILYLKWSACARAESLTVAVYSDTTSMHQPIGIAGLVTPVIRISSYLCTEDECLLTTVQTTKLVQQSLLHCSHIHIMHLIGTIY
jgi:hypothetical protein